MWNKIKNHDDLPFLIVWTIVLALAVVVICTDIAAGATGTYETCLGGQHVEIRNEVIEGTPNTIIT